MLQDHASFSGGRDLAGLDDTLARQLAAQPERVSRLQLGGGQSFWLKRVEQLSLRLRLQKGNPARSFEAERAGLHFLAQLGLPVPQILREGPDYFLLPDAGPTLASLATDEAVPVAARLDAFAAAGRALALLHQAGLSHGRPAPRDICWDGTVARFIDLERFSPRRHGRVWQALDIVIFTQSCFTRWPGEGRWLEEALSAYAAAAPEGACAEVLRLARRLRWLKGPARLALLLKPRSKEPRAILLTLDRLSRLIR